MSPYFSNFISFSRFPIILGIICIHASFTSNHNTLYFVLGETFGRIGVPLFFTISGYLFFNNYSNTKKVYFEKIKKRFFSLLIPYMLWNFIAYVIYSNITNTMSADQFFQAFWVVEGKEGHSPADGPLWFIRSLMLYSITAPFFYILNKHRYLSWISPFFLICWVLDEQILKSGFIIGFIFFNFGAWITITNKDIYLPIPSKLQSIIIISVYLVGALIHIYFRAEIFHKFLILFGFSVMYCLPNILKFRYIVKLSSLSFGLYCTHEIVLEILHVFNIIQIKSGNVKYLLSVFITTAISLFFFSFLQRYFPKTAKLLLGNRDSTKSHSQK